MPPSSAKKPHIVMIIPRGESVRNFLYSDTLKILSDNARVTLLSVIDDDRFMAQFSPYVERIIPLKQYPEKRFIHMLRLITYDAHFRWMWGETAKNNWEMHDARAKQLGRTFQRAIVKFLARLAANRPTLEFLTKVDQFLSWHFRPNDDLVQLFEDLKPDLVFNTSHIHGPAGELPAKISYKLGIPTVGFIFSWDNLTTRGRIFVPYDYYLVWHQGMHDKLLEIYPHVDKKRVFITGTPQFDYHFKPEYLLSREELASKIGFDPNRPYILYTTGMAKDFPDEHRTVEYLIELLKELDLPEKPQLVVRTYAKGTSEEMKAIGRRGLPDVYFPEVLWDHKWLIPQYEDLSIYTSLVKHAAMGINAASTVSLELMMFDKPVMNLAFDPPGSDLPPVYRWIRHIKFDHYWPVANSGGVNVAWKPEEMKAILLKGLTHPEEDSDKRKTFINRVFGDTLDGKSGERVAHQLLFLAEHAR
ncbi:MAG: hypothetical protein D6675_05135 [Gemmatimonadetes bacterium]|nr:MAG: hypothetical protein D6675_05135 [Gemmatimonadota bacterium]